MTVSESFKRFQYFNFETNVLENENLFQKTEVPFLVETTKIEIISFPLKIALSATNFKKTEWQLQNGPITKSGILPVTTLFFWKNFPSFRTS